MAELRAPSSGINVTPCADAFPPPPESVTKRACDPDGPSPVSDEDFILTQQGHASAEQATAWYYCLTETSLRRTIDQILDVFYKDDSASWLDRPVSLLLKSAHSFEKQLTSWCVTLSSALHGPSAYATVGYSHCLRRSSSRVPQRALRAKKSTTLPCGRATCTYCHYSVAPSCILRCIRHRLNH